MEGEDVLGEEPRLVVVAGQYQSATEVTGTERVFRSLTFKVYTSDSADASAPAINEVSASGIGGKFAKGLYFPAEPQRLYLPVIPRNTARSQGAVQVGSGVVDNCDIM